MPCRIEFLAYGILLAMALRLFRGSIRRSFGGYGG